MISVSGIVIDSLCFGDEYHDKLMAAILENPYNVD